MIKLDKIRFTAPCHFGLESVLSFEVKRIGGENVTVQDGKVSFDGDFYTLVKANMYLSVAERVFINLGEFKALSFEDLFQGVKNLPLENYIGSLNAFPVKGYSINSQLHSIPDCQAIVKKAAVERLKSVYNVSWFDETEPTVQISFGIHKDIASIYLDTSGVGLHKRGYRRNSNDAPIKETLAAGMVDFARVRGNSIVCDPFCGSGTILIESAFKALNIAPGLRRKFAAERWGVIPNEVWADVRAEAMAKIDKQAAFQAFGADIDDDCTFLTEENARKAGVRSKFSLMTDDIRNYDVPKNAITICNPPYGERLLELKEAEKLYQLMGEKFRPTSENPCYIISPHEDFEKFFGRKADKRRKLYNGMIKCQLFMYFK